MQLKFPCTFIIIALSFFFSQSLFAQEQHELTLQQCIDLAQINGPNAKMAKNTFRNKIFTYRSFNGGLLPQITLNGTAPNYQHSITPVTQPDGTIKYVALAQVNSSLSLSLNQPLLFSGGTIFANSSLSRTDLFGTQDATFWQASPVVVGIRQPLFQLNNFWWDNQTIELQNTEAQKKFNEDMEDAAIDVTQKFFDVYVAQMRVANADLNIAINDTLLTISRGRFEVGKIDETDLLQSELALANAQTALSNAKLDYKIALRTLAIAIGTTENEVLGIILPPDLPEVNITVDKALEQAHLNRSDLVNYELQKLSAERNLRGQELANGFNATITASFGYNQTAPFFNDAYHNLVDQQAARLDLSIPLLQWGRGANAISAAQENLYSTETSIDLEKKTFDQNVETQVERFLQNQQQLRLSMKADTIAQQQYILSKNRYLIGKYDVTKLLLSQNAKDNARESLIVTEQNYWLSYFRLRRMTLFDFETGRPVNYIFEVQ